MVRLSVERLEAREVMSVGVAAPVAADFTPPIGSNKGSFLGDGWWVAVVGERQPAPAAGICAVWHD